MVLSQENTKLKLRMPCYAICCMLFPPNIIFQPCQIAYQTNKRAFVVVVVVKLMLLLLLLVVVMLVVFFMLLVLFSWYCCWFVVAEDLAVVVIAVVLSTIFQIRLQVTHYTNGVFTFVLCIIVVFVAAVFCI